ncbi:MAG TPA: hypothetical protein VER11_12750 [Polyangiaceae bacterium]|nr:hypothetical protein [Polyangiaceae bacterium]
MIGFRVVLNGKQLVTAGFLGHHVLSAIVSSVVRDPARKASWQGKRAFVEREVELSVGGLDIDREQHVSWLSREFAVGDRIEIQIVDAGEFDEPRSRRPRKPAVTNAAESKVERKQVKKARANSNASVKPSAAVNRKSKAGRKKS